MRILALLFSAVSIYELLQLVNIEIVQFMPGNATGPEGGMISAAIALMFGSAAAMFALMFAFRHFQRARNKSGSRLLLAWCCLVPVGFIAVFIYAHAHSA